MHDVTVSVWNRFHSFPLIKGLSAAGFDVLGLCTTRRKPAAASVQTCWSAGLLTQATYRFPSLKDLLIECALRRYESFAMRRALESRCFWGWSNQQLAAFRRAKGAGLPVILESGSTHVLWIREILSAEMGMRGVSYRDAALDRRTPQMIAEYELADWICVPNSFAAKTYTAHGIAPGKLFINPYGVDIDFWSTDTESEDRPINGKFIVIFAGQFMLRKGAAYLMEAWRTLEFPGAELWIVGAIFDDAMPYLDRLPPNVKVLGTRRADGLRRLYAEADVFVLPSLEEGMSRAVLEAMAAGLPVIVTEETGFTDVIRDGVEGWLIASKSAEAIAHSLRSAAADPDATRRKGAAARERVKGYTWKAYGARAAQFLRTVLSGA